MSHHPRTSRAARWTAETEKTDAAKVAAQKAPQGKPRKPKTVPGNK